MNAVLKYPGAKNRIADWIVQSFPQHTVYLEPYFGSGAVLFNKYPARLETINDIDSNVVNLFKVIRENPLELADMITMTPWSHEEFSCSTLSIDTKDEVERARLFLVRSWQGIAGAQRYSTGWKHSIAAVGPRCANAWSRLPETILQAADRLKGVQIECTDAIDLIQKFNCKEALIYVDPPYMPDSRKNGLYKYEYTKNDHIKLLECIKGHKGHVVISAYENPLYVEALTGWIKRTKSTQAEAGQSRVEVLWMNYEAKQIEFQ